jgi:excisionase family DNA binding protein
MSSIGDRLLTIGEAAAFVRRSTRTIRRWIANDQLRAVRLGRSIWIREGDLLLALGLGEEAGGDAQVTDTRRTKNAS